MSGYLEALIFSTIFQLGFDLEEFQTILPKNLIHHMVKGEPIYDFFEAWKQSTKGNSFVQDLLCIAMVQRLGRGAGGEHILYDRPYNRGRNKRRVTWDDWKSIFVLYS